MTGSSLAETIKDFRQHLGRYDRSSQSPSRRRILEVYLRLAVENGFNSVTMRMIAGALNIKAPSLYAHFPEGRDEIVAESLRWHFYKFGLAILEELTLTDSAEEAWSAMVKVHLRRQLELPESNLWDLLIATDRMVHFLPADISLEADEMVTLYENLFRAAAREMGFPDPDEAVRLAMTLLEGASRWCDWTDDPSTQALLAQRATELTRSMLHLTSSWTGAATAGLRRLTAES